MFSDYEKNILRDTLNVSRETLEKLEVYGHHLLKWNDTYNLIGSSTEDDLGMRHFIDSAQLLPHIPATAKSLLDIGSGAGFPGLVLSICGVKNVHLVDPNQKKCLFLRHIARTLHLSVTIHQCAVEGVQLDPFDVITSRAFAALSQIFVASKHLSCPKTTYLLLKGQDYKKELEELQMIWTVRHKIIDSMTSPTGKILVIKGSACDETN